jgi:hypothetical protein
LLSFLIYPVHSRYVLDLHHERSPDEQTYGYMPLVKSDAISAPEMISVLTTESAENMGLKPGETV